MKKEEKSFFSFKFEEPEPKRRRLPKRLRAGRRPELTIEQILEWADAHHARTGKWPIAKAGRLHEDGNESWNNIENALLKGYRGLPGNSSIARLLATHRGVRNRKALPPLTDEQILRWADAHRSATGDWPTENSGRVAGDPSATWVGVDLALRHGLRSLPGGSSLARLLAEHRGKRNPGNLPSLSVEQILGWADAHFRRTGSWPTEESGSIEEAEDNWHAINRALKRGHRGLPGGTTLPQLLAKNRGRRNHMDLQPLRMDQILDWEDAHFRRTGRWPTMESGPIEGAAGESWLAVDASLRVGYRGLPGGTSLANLLQERRSRRNRADLPLLSVDQILGWADAHFRRAGRWPKARSGPIDDVPGESWAAVNNALALGRRGLPGGSSLHRLLVRHRRKLAR